MSAYVDGTSTAKEGDGEVFCGCLDVLLVAGDCGEAEASVCELKFCCDFELSILCVCFLALSNKEKNETIII